MRRAQRDAPIGGQAVLEGVMMRGVGTWAVAVRAPTPTDGELGEVDVLSFPLASVLARRRFLRLPILRGVVALGESLAIGFRALGISANTALRDPDAPTVPVAANGDRPRGDGQHSDRANGDRPDLDRPVGQDRSAQLTSYSRDAAPYSPDGANPRNAAEPADPHATPGDQALSGGVWAGTVIVAVAFAIGLFFLVPVGITSLIRDQLGLGSSLLFWLIEGLVRTAIFLGYLLALSRVRDLRRVFEYHGAEHKTISCFEAGEELTPAQASTFSRLHPRCGTSFLLIVMVVAIFVFAPLGLPAWYWLMVTRVLGVPIIAGISFELVKLAGRHRRRRFVQVLMWPGMQLQRLTTREPDHDQLAVAIAALQAVLAVETPGKTSARDLVGLEVVA